MSDRSKFIHLDAHVRQAWRTHKFTDNTPINLGRTDKEQAFLVKADGIFEIKAVKRNVIKCGSKDIITTRFDRNALRPYAGGHTHPRGKDGKIEQYPGPLDGSIAKITYLDGMLSYVISYKGAYAVSWSGFEYAIHNIIGKNLSEKKISKIIKKWQIPQKAIKKCIA